jgi:hypothetical protein
VQFQCHAANRLGPQVVHYERLYERTRSDSINSNYFGRVRLRMKAGAGHVLRERTGFSAATGKDLAEVHERSLQAPELQERHEQSF